MAAVTARCAVCRAVLYADDDQLVLAIGRRRQAHCSEACLEETVRALRRARAVRRRRAVAGASVLALLLAGALTIRRHRAPPPRSISHAWPETGWDRRPVAPGPTFFGPAWPPTDEDWTFAFDRVSWIYPLPGPVRRPPAADDRIFPETPRNHPAATCRKPGVCGVALGGQLWGEHVYAVQDGVIDFAKAYGNEEHGGCYVRIAHFGGMAFTHYFHLAAIPRGVRRGARVAAGDVIGLVGDTGVGGEPLAARRPHLHFALSVRPSSEMTETYWDPGPMMASWPMRVPPNGTVAGLAAPVVNEDLVRRRRGR
jgi:murein DD-endopeptidase MepM/ murein hydrolase activator NlpD